MPHSLGLTGGRLRSRSQLIDTSAMACDESWDQDGYRVESLTDWISAPKVSSDGHVTLTFGTTPIRRPAASFVLWDSAASIGVEPTGSTVFKDLQDSVKVTTIHGAASYPKGFAIRDSIRWKAVSVAYPCAICPGAAFSSCGNFDYTELIATITLGGVRTTFSFQRATDGHYYNLNGMTPLRSAPVAPHLPLPLSPSGQPWFSLPQA